MATVKGDVHDIGKNIVAVVLRCNNFEVIDMGVMVPCEKILETAVSENCDIIGLSGLITPSLDEMVTVAKEMQRKQIDKPLLIGGATTSKAHTSVKIDPVIDINQVVYVADASRAVGVATKLLSDSSQEYKQGIKAEYKVVRERRAASQNKRKAISYSDALQKKYAINWDNYTPPEPQFLGYKTLENYPLEKLVDFIDWTPFFISWDLAGKYPNILKDKVVGEAATNLFNDAQAMLNKIIEQKLLTAHARFGFWKASADGDDIFLKNQGDQDIATLHHIRQQVDKGNNHGNFLSLADFIAPQDNQAQDYMGGFIVSTGFGAEELAREYEANNDDYNSIMIKALADRFAEAFAEHLHKRVREEFWGYVKDESLTNEELIKEKYLGIRPAPGYPACPDHTEKATLFALLNGEEIGVTLTEHFAMAPAASVSGWYFSHPESRYFNVGKISKDQVESLAARKGASIEHIERWLQPNLDY